MAVRQDDGGQAGNVTRLIETVRQLCGAVEALTASNTQERERRIQAEEAMTAAEQAKADAEQAVEEQCRRVTLMESRLADWDVPPVCDCGRIGYVIYCRCGKQLK